MIENIQEKSDSTGDFILVDISKVYSEIEKERVIAAVQSRIRYGEVLVKKKNGIIQSAEVRYTLHFPIKNKE